MDERKRAAGSGRKRKVKIVEDPPEGWREALDAAARKLEEVSSRPVNINVFHFEVGSNPTVVVSEGAAMTQFKNEIAGNVGNLAQGEKSQATNLGNINQGSPPEATATLATLSLELDKLLDAMEKEEAEPEHEAGIGMVKAAVASVRKGDASKAAIFLQKTGKSALGVATKIGSSIAIAALKNAAGL